MSVTVPATLFYSTPPKDGSSPWLAVNHDAPTKNTSNFDLEPKEVLIENVRGKESSYSLDTSGFQFITHPSAHKRFTDNEEIKREYYPDCEKIIKKFTGASHVLIFDHTIRKNRPGVSTTSEHLRKPVPRVHVDQTPEAADRRARMHASELGPELASELLKYRYQILNLWRPISHPADDFPLAVCDYRSVNWDQDLMTTTLRLGPRDGQTFYVKYNPEHKWKYLKGMRPDEALLFKCSDSKMDGSVAVLTPHTAFIDPTTPKNAPLRESIELRAVVFYGNGPNSSAKL